MGYNTRNNSNEYSSVVHKACIYNTYYYSLSVIIKKKVEKRAKQLATVVCCFDKRRLTTDLDHPFQ